MEFFIVLIAAIYFIVKLITGLRDEAYAKKLNAENARNTKKFFEMTTNQALECEAVRIVQQSIMTAKKIPEIEAVCEEIGIPYPDNKQQAVQILMGLQGFVPGCSMMPKIMYWSPNASMSLKSWDPKLDSVETRRVQKKFFIWLSEQLRKHGNPHKIYAFGPFRPKGSHNDIDSYIAIDNPAQIATFYVWDEFMMSTYPIIQSLDRQSPCYDPDYKE